LHGVPVDFDDPRTDVIDVDFGPRGDRHVARSKLTLRSLSGADLGTRSALGNDVTDNVADLGAPKVCADHSFELVHTGGVSTDFVTVLAELGERGVWADDSPFGVIGRTETDAKSVLIVEGTIMGLTRPGLMVSEERRVGLSAISDRVEVRGMSSLGVETWVRQ